MTYETIEKNMVAASASEKQELIADLSRAKVTVDKIGVEMDEIQSKDNRIEECWNLINGNMFVKMKDAIIKAMIVGLVSTIIGFIPVLAFLSIFAFIIAAIILIKRHKQINEEKQWAQNEINTLNREKTVLYEKIQAIIQTEEGAFAKKTLPKDYFYPEAVKMMIYYLENGQADTRKEALKEYDKYVHRCKMEYEAARAAAASERTEYIMKGIAQNMQNIANNTAQIAESTRIMERHTATLAFWSWYDHL